MCAEFQGFRPWNRDIRTHSSALDQAQLAAGWAPTATGAQLQSSEDDVVHPLLVLGDAGRFRGLADFASRGFQLIPDVAAPLDEEWVSRVDHDRSYTAFEHGHASHSRVKRPDGDDPEASLAVFRTCVGP